MSLGITILSSLTYLLILFGVAYFSERYAEKGKSLVSNPYVYALSLAVFCTAWTFYGSVGRAASTGAGFLPIYLGPTLTAPLWIIILRKIIIISKTQRITSIADFISSRYGKSTQLGVLATFVALFGIIPYISIQLKAISVSFETLTNTQLVNEVIDQSIYLDTSHYITFFLAVFTILFGARHLEATERHEGLVAAVAFESIIKLVAFVAAGIFVTFFIYDGFGDIFQKALENPDLAKLFDPESAGLSGWEWGCLMGVSMFAILLLPRQFHIAVVENTSSNHVNKAIWLFPLYLLVINIFVLPIAFGGVLHFSSGGDADMFILNLPLIHNQGVLALFVFIGGLSAATSMVIVATIALSIMLSNNIFLPLILKVFPFQEEEESEITSDFSVQRILFIRRLSIVLVLALAYLYFKTISEAYTLVSIGLISFAAVAQFAPSLIGGLYWKQATRHGAFWGLFIGFLIWGYTLPFSTLADAGLIPSGVLENGPWGIEWLKPRALLGLDGVSSISQSIFWSLFFNTLVYVGVSIFTDPSPIEHRQANIFINIYKYANESFSQEVLKRTAVMYDIKILLNRYLGKNRTEELLENYAQTHNLNLQKTRIADADLINYAEKVLAGAIGAASSRILIESIVKEDPISLDEVMSLLDQTQEIMLYSKALEKKSRELEFTTQELKAANERLKELDLLKDDFITTITHELRTPITSIKALARILHDTAEIQPAKKQQFLEIIVSESERIARLINQVLDLEKTQIKQDDWKNDTLDFRQIVLRATANITPITLEKGIALRELITPNPLPLIGDEDRLTQVVINLLSNAIKFCDAENGHIEILLFKEDNKGVLKVKDNGKGIAPKNQPLIFDRFTQISDDQKGKPKGSGLGLFISKNIVEHHGGIIGVNSALGEGATFFVELPITIQN